MQMKFAKIVFWSAGAWGVLALTPLYFMFDMISRQDPPPITHPQFYYGFAGVTMAWQFAFFVIATDPARFRPMMIPSMLEKLGYVIAVIVLYLQRRMSPVQLMTGVRGTLLGLLFVIAFFKTRRSPEARRLFLPSVVSSWRAWPAIRPLMCQALNVPTIDPQLWVSRFNGCPSLVVTALNQEESSEQSLSG